jgi:hypothetical protein
MNALVSTVRSGNNTCARSQAVTHGVRLPFAITHGEQAAGRTVSSTGQAFSIRFIACNLLSSMTYFSVRQARFGG